jgi:hypothetical protein
MSDGGGVAASEEELKWTTVLCMLVVMASAFLMYHLFVDIIAQAIIDHISGRAAHQHTMP